MGTELVYFFIIIIGSSCTIQKRINNIYSRQYCIAIQFIYFLFYLRKGVERSAVGENVGIFVAALSVGLSVGASLSSSSSSSLSPSPSSSSPVVVTTGGNNVGIFVLSCPILAIVSVREVVTTTGDADGGSLTDGAEVIVGVS